MKTNPIFQSQNCPGLSLIRLTCGRKTDGDLVPEILGSKHGDLHKWVEGYTACQEAYFTVTNISGRSYNI